MNKKVQLIVESLPDSNNVLGFIKMNNPPVNSLSIDLVKDINLILDDIPKNISGLVFKSEGKGFCAGADLKERARMSNSQTIEIVDSYNNLFNKINNISYPTIAAIHGYAIGGGLELALACDFRVAVNNAIFSFPETSLGIIPGAGGTQRLPKLIGVSRAKKWIFTAEKFNAVDALNDNVIDEIFDSQELMEDFVQELMHKITKNSENAISLAKKSINHTSACSLDKGLIFERKQYLKTLKDPFRLKKLKEFEK